MKKNVKKIVVTALSVLTLAVTCLVFVGCDHPTGKTPEEVYTVNGFQQRVSDASKLATVDGASIISVSEMLNAEGLTSLSDAEDKKTIAGYIYNLAVLNNGNLVNKSFMVKTDASVHAADAKTQLGKMDTIDVGIRSTFSVFDGDKGNFSQTVSGVTKLDVFGSLGNMLKGMFGYNIQSFSNDKITANRRGGNGGAKFLSDEDDDVLKYILGAKYGDWPSKVKDKGGKTGHFVVNEKVDEQSGAASSAAATSKTPWRQLSENSYGDPITLTVNGVSTDYYLGNYGNASWATYNFDGEYLADESTVEYDAATDIYTLKLVVKADKIDEACKFAKGALVKDTKDYIQLEAPTYTKLENTIQVYGNGLIKRWDREEQLGSDKNAKLIVISGDCAGGGYTGNSAITVFSYDELDTNAERLAALYWPELGVAKTVGANFALDLSSYPDFDGYKPKVNKVGK